VEGIEPVVVGRKIGGVLNYQNNYVFFLQRKKAGNDTHNRNSIKYAPNWKRQNMENRAKKFEFQSAHAQQAIGFP
jgi:hypothetical protein